MKVVVDRPDRLVVQDTPWRQALVLGGGALLACVPAFLPLPPAARIGGALIGLLFAGSAFTQLARRRLVLDRAAGTVTLETRRLLRLYRESHLLSALRIAEIRSRNESAQGWVNDMDGIRRETRSRRADRPTLVLSDGTEIPFAERASGAAPALNRINTWLALRRDEGLEKT